MEWRRSRLDVSFLTPKVDSLDVLSEVNSFLTIPLGFSSVFISDLLNFDVVFVSMSCVTCAGLRMRLLGV